MGGAQGVAALAYGVEGIRPVDKIVGPGNLFVALAKKHVFGEVDIDSIAGPSEVVVIADDTTPADFTAADLIAQAEHAPGASVLITWSRGLSSGSAAELARQLAHGRSRRVARHSLEQFGALILVADADEAARLADEIAPEHLHIACQDAERAGWRRFAHAGAVFLGNYTPGGGGRLCRRPLARVADRRHGPVCQRTVGQRFSAGRQRDRTTRARLWRAWPTTSDNWPIKKGWRPTGPASTSGCKDRTSEAETAERRVQDVNLAETNHRMSYFRPEIEAMHGYTPGEQPQAGKFIKLNTNENPYPASPAVGRAIAAVVERGLGPLSRSDGHGLSPPGGRSSVGRSRLDSVRQRQRRPADDRHAGVRRPGPMAAAPLPQLHPLSDVGRAAGRARPKRFTSSPTGRSATISRRSRSDLRLAFLPNPNSPSGTVLVARARAGAGRSAALPAAGRRGLCRFCRRQLPAAGRPERKDHGFAVAEQVVCVGRAAIRFRGGAAAGDSAT